ncbi:Neuroblast differentiation-associated protein AHNAK [Bagarius yarrelli]|uniref:Neuroblast differentiation-associated protein AHNAK n=1 Tax=Bagarius yarrelli TaxID=175774 RepID=A0A556V1W0_BAGYA|nr:Neuroblast differentiation-associated protein AHNAK [Bagarius yarrelli]
MVVETEADIGASGYSVVGGGTKGIFIKDVLKDSPAAKHLSLKKGDQLLSARVYFDNVKYEDALKILQCAEPYKVSFFLKRTVAQTEVSTYLETPNIDHRGPRTKMEKMSVQNVKQFKAKKKRGGRFGLKRLKEKKGTKAEAERDNGNSSGRLDFTPGDLEFALPKFKLKKHGKIREEQSENLKRMKIHDKKTKKITFPKVKIKPAMEGAELSTTKGEREMYKDKEKCSKLQITDNDEYVQGKTISMSTNIQIPNPNLETKQRTEDEANGSMRHGENMMFVNVKGSDVKHAKVSMPSTEISLPKSKAEREIENRIKFQVPGMKLPEGGIHVDGPEIKVGQVDLPSTDISLPKANVKEEIVLKGGAEKKETIDVEKSEISLPKVAPPMVDFNVKGPDIQGRKIHMPDLDILLPMVDFSLPGMKLPEGKINVDEPDIKYGKVGMPCINVSLPEGQAKVNLDIKGNSGKRGKFELPEVDISLPKVRQSKGDFNVEGPDNKGRNLSDVNVSLPKVDLTVPSMTLPEGKINVVGPGIKYGEVDMPSVDILLPKGEAKVDLDVEGYSGEGGKFELQKFDSSLPKVTPPKVDFNIEVPDIKRKKINMPDIDLSLSKGKGTEGVDLIVGAGKGGRFQMPKVDLSLPKIKLPESGFHVNGSDIKVGQEDMQSFDISLPKPKVKIDLDVKGDSGKKGMFELPMDDITLPNITPPKADFTVEGPHIKGRKFHMPDVDVSLPKVDPSLPSIKLPDGKINVKKADIKYEKMGMPSIDISLPKGEAKADLDIERHSGKGGKFELQKGDISSPKVTPPIVDFNIEVPESQGRKIHMPDIDISLPKGRVTESGELKVTAGKRERFQMPKVDLSLPRIKLPEGGIHVDGPNIKVGQVDMPSIDISLPKADGKAEIDTKGLAEKKGSINVAKLDMSVPNVKTKKAHFNFEDSDIKGRKFHIPDVDVSLPKVDLSLPNMKFSESKINVEGSEIKYEKIDMPSIDISLEKGKAKADLDIEGFSGKGGKFEVPKADISLPKVTPPKVEFNIEVPGLKGKKINMPDIDISLPKGNVTEGVDLKGGSEKGGRFQMPKVDLSLPRIKLPEGGIHVDGPDIKVGKVDMPSIDISSPQGNAKQEIDVKCGAGKKGTIDVPNLDISLPKVTPPMVDFNVEGPLIKGKKFHMPDVDISLPKVDLSLPRIKFPEGKINVEGPDIKYEKVDMPSVDISLPKGEANIDLNTEGHSGKGGMFELPKVDISLPKITPPKVDFSIEEPEIKGKKINMPDIDISLPKGKVTEGVDLKGGFDKGGRFQMPKVDLSLPRIKLPEGGIHVDGPDIKVGKVDMPSIDISSPQGNAKQEIDVKCGAGKKGTIDVPNLDISLPKVTPPMVDFNVEGPHIKGRKFHMPDVDISLPKVDFSLPSMKLPEGKINVEGPDIKYGKVDIPSVDISLPKGEANVDLTIDGHSGKVTARFRSQEGGRFQMPKVDLSLPRIKLPEGGIHVDGPDIKVGKVDMPSIDISLPKGNAKQEIDVKVGAGNKGTIDVPNLDISLPKVTPPMVDFNVEGPHIKGRKFHMPDVDISLAKIDLSLPSIKFPEGKINVGGPDIKYGKVDIPSVDLSLPKGEANVDLTIDGHSGKGGKFELPKVDISLPKVTPPKVDFNIEAPEIKGKKIKHARY